VREPQHVRSTAVQGIFVDHVDEGAQLASELAARYRGTVVKLLGDGGLRASSGSDLTGIAKADQDLPDGPLMTAGPSP